MLIVVACFVSILGLFSGIYWFFIVRPETEAARAIARRLNPNGPVRLAVESPSLLKAIVPLSSLPLLERLLTRFVDVLRPLEKMLGRSGMRVTVSHLLLGSTFTAAIGFAAVLYLTDVVWFAIGAAGCAGSLPFFFFRWAARRRIAKFEEQFPEAIDLVARALRAGHALTTGLSMVAEEVREPVRSEFQLVYDRQSFGMPLPDALKGLAARIPLLDVQFFVTAVLTQRESGGNLAEVLDSLAALIRERSKLRRQVRTLSAHGRITGAVLAGLPVALAGLMFLVAPDHIKVLFTDPLGIRMVGAAIVLQVIGFTVMQRIVNIEI
jgi:tight adherence protein B